MADLRIVDAPEIPTSNITGGEKIPTGGNGNYSISLDSLADYTKTKKDLADNTSVDTKVNGVRQELESHIEDLLNPHQVTKGQIGLGNVDNTADADKPVSNSTQAAIISAVAPKADKTYVDNALSSKSDKTYVDNALASKSDKTYVDTQLALKANKADVYTKSETYTKQESNDLVNNSISTALSPVNTSLGLAKRGVINRYDSSLTYNSGERVVLTNGDIVKSTIDGNTNDPNVDMTGWRLDDNTVESIADLLAIQNPKDGQVVYVKKTDSHFIFDGVWQPNIVNEINLAAFPRLSSEVDDTGRFLRASESIKQIQAISPPSGTASVTTTHLYIPFGEYFISDSITLNPYVHVISDDMPTIKQTTVGKDIFVFNESFSNVVRGIRFFNGRYSIVFKNSNIDQTVLMVDGCEFHRSESYAIHTIGLTESQHMSALLNITGCKFSLCNKILHNVCDKTVLSKSWAYLFFGNFDADSASIMNRYGRLDIEHLLGVPWLGSPNPFWGGGTRLVNTRWIDNYSILDCFKCRFGLESDGLTVVHSFGGADDLGNGMGSTITLRSCQVSGGDAQWLPASETGVIRIRAKMPRKIVIDDCNYQLNSPAITLSENYDFLSYLRTLVSDQSKLGQYLKDNIIISINNNERVLLDGMKNVPDVLAQFVNQGMDLQAHKVAVTATDTYVSYNLPVGTNGALYEFMISGNTNPSGSKLYSYSTRYNLMIGTGYNGTGLVFYAQGIKVPQGGVPPSITISGGNLSIEPFFGDGVTGSDTLENNGIAAVRYVTLKISNSKEVKVSANLLSVH